MSQSPYFSPDSGRNTDLPLQNRGLRKLVSGGANWVSSSGFRVPSGIKAVRLPARSRAARPSPSWTTSDSPSIVILPLEDERRSNFGADLPSGVGTSRTNQSDRPAPAVARSHW